MKLHMIASTFSEKSLINNERGSLKFKFKMLIIEVYWFWSLSRGTLYEIYIKKRWKNLSGFLPHSNKKLGHLREQSVIIDEWQSEVQLVFIIEVYATLICTMADSSRQKIKGMLEVNWQLAKVTNSSDQMIIQHHTKTLADGRQKI